MCRAADYGNHQRSGSWRGKERGQAGGSPAGKWQHDMFAVINKDESNQEEGAAAGEEQDPAADPAADQ